MPNESLRNISSIASPGANEMQKICQDSSIDTKDATLIELLRRGTKVAVKCAISDTRGSITINQPQTPQTTNILLPAQCTTPLTPMTPSSTSPFSISLARSNTVTGTPVALAISQAPNDSNGIYTLAYSTNSSNTYFTGNDTAMLLDSIQLVQSSNNDEQLDDLTVLDDYSFRDDDLENLDILAQYTPSRQFQTVLPDTVAEFSTKDYVFYGCADTKSSTQSEASPASPLSYPTPPASHEGVTQLSPFLDDSLRLTDTNSFFDNKNVDGSTSYFEELKNGEHFLQNDQFLPLESNLFNDRKSAIVDNIFFESKPKNVYDIMTESSTAGNNNAVDFKRNWEHMFLDDDAFLSNAAEVKEALEEVLPNDNISCGENCDIGLYYIDHKSQIMLNANDPLLSSSPKEFTNKIQEHKFDFADELPITTTIKVENEQNSDKCIKERSLSPNEIGSNKDNLPIPSCMSIHQCQTSLKIDTTKPKMKYVPRKQIAYKSKLRAVYVPHYTPAPILNPERNGVGLYNSINADFFDDVLDYDFSCASVIAEKSNINIGADFQADIPDFVHDKEVSRSQYTEIDLQLWNPEVLDDEKQINRFVDLAKSSSIPVGCHSEEVALRTLSETSGDVHSAIFAMMNMSPAAIHNRWLQSEIETFLKGLEEHGKDFSKIGSYVSIEMIL